MGRGLGRFLVVALIAATLQISTTTADAVPTPIARAWGENNEGELGIGTNSIRTRQTAVRNTANNADFGAVIDMDGGSNHSVWLKADGTVYSAGDDSLGQQGNTGGVTDGTTPVQVVGLSNVLQVDAGSNFTLALVSDGTLDGNAADGDVWGWGHNNSGQIGVVGTGFENSEVPVAVVGAPPNVVDIAANGSHALAVTDAEEVWAWGHNAQGQLGNNTSGDGTNSNVPARVHDIDGVGFLPNIAEVDAGTTHSVARADSGEVYVWGSGGSGQMGDGTANSIYDLPVQTRGVDNVGFLDDVVQIAAGGAHNLARLADGSVAAWGANSDGQTGDNRPPNLFTPKLVIGEGGTGTLAGAEDIAAGSVHSYAVAEGDFVFAWGANSSIACQAGQGSCDSTDFFTPIQVQQLFGANNVEAGMFYGLANSDADTTAPTGTVSIDGGATYANSTSVTLTLTADDGSGAGVESMRFSNDGTTFSAWENFGTTKSWTLASGDGSKTVRVQFRDAVGNASASFTDDITLDATAPTGSVSIDSGDPATNTTGVTLTLSADDGTGSGVDTMAFSDYGSTFTTPEPFATSKSYTLPSGDGSKTVHVRYADEAGNTVTVTDDITLDTANPTGTVVINNDAPATNTTSVTLDLTADGTGSSIADMAFSDNGTDFTTPEAFAATKPYTLPSGDGAKTVHVRYTDTAGNTTTVTDSITLDTAAPSGTIAINNGSVSTSSPNVTLTLSASDGSGSGVTQMAFSDNGTDFTTPEAFVTSKPYTLPGDDGPNTVHVRFFDAAGNSFTTSATIELDTTAPAVVSFSPTGRRVRRSANVVVTFSEPVSPGGGVRLEKGGVPLAGVTTVVGSTVTFDPAAKLKAGKRYTGRVITDVEDSAGNSIPQEVVWTFRVRS